MQLIAAARGAPAAAGYAMPRRVKHTCTATRKGPLRGHPASRKERQAYHERVR